MSTITTRCCIAGGGPAGIMLGYMLARSGIDVVVLEKWPDFFRDFRGDTIHPSTMDVLHELGLLEGFLKLPHNETRQMIGRIDGQEIQVADFTRLNVRCPFIAFIPQWDFLTYIASCAKPLPHFRLMMETEATDIVVKDGRVLGIKAKGKDGEFEIRADLTIGADGRHSTIREKSGLHVEDLGAPIDVLWFRVSRTPDGTNHSLGNIDGGRILVTLDRDDYWQCACIITKGDFETIKSQGLDTFRASMGDLAPYLAPHMHELTTWDQVKLLSVTVDHLTTWHREGLICIGDSAHAMSPVGGIGINMAIQDAVAAANILVPAFKRGAPGTDDLAAIQKRRESVTRRTQAFQVFLHRRVLAPILARRKHISFPGFMRIINAIPALQWIPARVIGIGLQPEHVEFERQP